MPEKCPFCKMKLNKDQQSLRICPYCKKVISENYTTHGSQDKSKFYVSLNKISHLLILVILIFGAYLIYNWLSDFSKNNKLIKLMNERNKYVEKIENIPVQKKNKAIVKVPSFNSPETAARTNDFPSLPECPYKFDEKAVSRFNAALEADMNAQLKSAENLLAVGSYYESFLLLKKLMADNQKNPFLLLRANMVLIAVLAHLKRPDEYREAWYNNFYLTELVKGNSSNDAKNVAMAYMKSFDKAQKLLDPEVMKRVKGPINPMVLKILKAMPDSKEAL